LYVKLKHRSCYSVLIIGYCIHFLIYVDPGGIGRSSEPDSTGKTKKKKKPNPLATPLVEEEKKQPESLEQWQEQQEREDNDILETRKSPEYTMTYRQAVGTEDVFLQV